MLEPETIYKSINIYFDSVNVDTFISFMFETIHDCTM